MIGGGSRYCGGGCGGRMAKAARRRQLRCIGRNGEDVGAVAVVEWQKRRGGSGWGGGSGGHMAEVARWWRLWLRCSGRNGEDTAAVAVFV